MVDKFSEILDKVKANSPQIHCITNPISINDCANFILAAGAKPIMAEHPLEVADITANSDALMLNLGNITDVRINSMRNSAMVAHELQIPFVLDLVGVGCSSLRLNFAHDIISAYTPSIIKGNASEIRAIAGIETNAKGVDADIADQNSNETLSIAVKLAKNAKCTVLASGKYDIITNGDISIICANGTSLMSKITGTGCIQGALCGVYLSCTEPIYAAACAATVMGICGELSYTESIGTGSFKTAMLDNMYNFSKTNLETRMKTEEWK